MRALSALVFLILSLSLNGAMADEDAIFDFGDDAFRAGADIRFERSGVADLFMAGDRLRMDADITGSAHLAGRRVIANGAIGGDAYAAGMDVELNAPVAGNATLAGYKVTVGNVGASCGSRARNSR